MARQDVFTQTDHEIHDVFYYKTRAYKAETALLTLRRDQYIHQLQVKLKEIEKDTTNKFHLYSYDTDKINQLKLEFQNQTRLTDHYQRKAQDIFIFNLHALNDGHELNELPLIEDKDIDLNTFRLGPVTPTIPSGSRAHPFLMANMSLGADNNMDVASGYSSTFTGGSGMMMTNGGGGGVAMNGFPPATPGAYIFPNSEDASSNPNSSHQIFNILYTGQANPIGTRPAAPPTSQFNDIDIQSSRGEEILRMISMESASNQPDSRHPNGRRLDSATHKPANASANKPPDVVPKTTNGRSNTSPPTTFASQASELAISGSMGLDHLDFDYSSAQKKTEHQKWSQIAAGSADVISEGDWQAVGSKKGRLHVHTSKHHPQPTAAGRTSAAPSFSVSETGANFEQMVVAVQEKYQLTRPEVIAVLQLVRNERNGDMNISLNELMRDAERLLSKNKNVLKPAGLTARARAVPDHEEPCENQLCPARLKLLKYRTELCLSYQTTGKCHMKPGSCVYAHGAGEQRPLPKEELCERYLDGKCNNKRCVYAHGVSELKNRPIVNTVEYLKSKHKKHAQENKSTSNEDYSLNEADLDPRGDECSICLERMSKKSRRKLDCGHDSFHYKCLKKWVAGEGDRSCPLCRSNTLLPEEYPRLGSQ